VALRVDPLAKLAQQQEQLRQRLTELAPPVPEEMTEAWQAAAEACLERPKEKGLRGEVLTEQWYVLVECRDERQQVELLTRFQGEGLTCKALLS
jgi:hypothetical protein